MPSSKRGLVSDCLGSGYFTPDDSNAFTSIRHSHLDGGDPFVGLADFDAYCRAQSRVDAALPGAQAMGPHGHSLSRVGDPRPFVGVKRTAAFSRFLLYLRREDHRYRIREVEV